MPARSGRSRRKVKYLLKMIAQHQMEAAANPSMTKNTGHEACMTRCQSEISADFVTAVCVIVSM